MYYAVKWFVSLDIFYSYQDCLLMETQFIDITCISALEAAQSRGGHGRHVPTCVNTSWRHSTEYRRGT